MGSKSKRKLKVDGQDYMWRVRGYYDSYHGLLEVYVHDGGRLQVAFNMEDRFRIFPKSAIYTWAHVYGLPPIQTPVIAVRVIRHATRHLGWEPTGHSQPLIIKNGYELLQEIGYIPAPFFRYHPDPIATGSIIPSENKCVVCDQKRGYIYTAYVGGGKSDYRDQICPWCIGDDSANEKLGVIFFDPDGVERSYPRPIKQSIVDEIVERTPGFFTWQGQYWLTHCNNAMKFLGSKGYTELLELGDDAIQAIADSTGLSHDAPDCFSFFESLDKDGAPRAYLFQCLHCRTYDGYTDTD